MTIPKSLAQITACVFTLTASLAAATGVASGQTPPTQPTIVEDSKPQPRPSAEKRIYDPFPTAKYYEDRLGPRPQ